MDTSSPSLVVCLKWVATSPEVDPLTGEVATDERFSGLSPADLAALEWALRVAEHMGRTVAAVTVGGPEADAGLRLALAHGVRAALRISRTSADSPSRTVARQLANTCRGADLVFCGDHSLDRGSGSVPAFLAHEIGSAQALGCVGLKLGVDSITVERRLDQGRRELLAASGPTVLSFEGGLELRRASLAATIASATEPILLSEALEGAEATSDGASLKLQSTGPYRPRAKTMAGPTGDTLDRIRQLTGVGEERQTAQQLELAPAEAAAAALEQLQAWGYVDPSPEP